LPFSFVGMMAIGAALGFDGVHLGAVEQIVAASVCVLGLVLTTAMRLPTIVCVGVVCGFAVFHGYAHAAEATDSNTRLYMMGFAISTVVLHAIGFGVAMLLNRHQRVIRWLGAVIAVSGAAMLFS